MRFRTCIAALLSHASPNDPLNTEISAEQIDHYREQDFVVIDDFLDADELADRDDQSGDSYYDKVFTQRLNLWMDHVGVRRLMLDTRLGKIMKAASCSFHNGLLAHGAAANMTPSRRRAMTCSCMPDGATFNGRPTCCRRITQPLCR